MGNISFYDLAMKNTGIVYHERYDKCKGILHKFTKKYGGFVEK